MTCAWCRAPLADEHGRPRWDLFGFGALLLFVCLGQCREAGRG